MGGNLVELESFNVCQWLSVRKPRYRFERGVCAGVDDYVFPAQLARRAIEQCGLEGLGPDEASATEKQFRASLFIVLEIHIVPPGYHSAFTLANGTHINGEASVDDAELTASAEM